MVGAKFQVLSAREFNALSVNTLNIAPLATGFPSVARCRVHFSRSPAVILSRNDETVRVVLGCSILGVTVTV